MISSLYEHIKKIELQLYSIEQESHEDFAYPANPFDPKTEPDQYLKFMKFYNDAYSSFTQQRKHYIDYAQLENALTKKQELIKAFIEDLPLYHKTQHMQQLLEKQQKIVATTTTS